MGKEMHTLVTGIQTRACIYLCPDPSCPLTNPVPLFGVEMPLDIFELLIGLSPLTPESHNCRRTRNNSTNKGTDETHIIATLSI